LGRRDERRVNKLQQRRWIVVHGSNELEIRRLDRAKPYVAKGEHG